MTVTDTLSQADELAARLRGAFEAILPEKSGFEK